MDRNLLNRAVGFFWKLFRLNLLFMTGNAVLIAAVLLVILHWYTLPIYLLGILLLIPSLQALFQAIKQLDKLEKMSPTRLYINCYLEEFKGSALLALGYILIGLLLLGAYVGLQFVPNQLAFVPFYYVLVIILYIHLVFSLLIRAYFVINIKGTLRLGFYCISKYPLKALFILGGTFIAGALMNIFHQLILLGLIPFAVYLLTVFSDKMFSDISAVLKIQIQEDEAIESENDRQ